MANKGAHDKFRYENAYRGHRCRICFSGGDDSVDTETRNNMDVLRDNMEYCSRSDSYRRSSSNTCSSHQLSVLASTIQGALGRHQPMPNSYSEQP